MKLCVFPNDPIRAYYKKGEIKERYFNPQNIFNEIHVISFLDIDVEEQKVQSIAGKANLKIHSVGKISLLNKYRKKNQILKLIDKIKPDIIRSYNALLEGWIAAYCSNKLNIPFFVSLHVEYNEKRNFIKMKNYKKYLALQYYKKNIEPFTLKSADKITIVYKIIEPYVLDIVGIKPQILYNRINLEKFQNGKKINNFDKPLILSVGRLTARKNHDCLIKAVKDLDVYLQIIGDGEEFKNLSNLVKELEIENKVIFTKSVKNEKIQDYYKSADLFVSVFNPKIEGLPIPVLEAMASGLPTIISKPIKGLSDGLEDSVVFSDIKSHTLTQEIKKILYNDSLSKSLSEKAIKKSKEFDGKKMEMKEAEIYQELVKGS